MNEIHFELNGFATVAQVADHELLIDVLRNRLQHTGTKEGCGQGECGACSVLVDGRLLNACLYPALELEGRSVLTIEGLLGPGGRLSPVQQAFVDKGGIQCGFCSPGMILSAWALLRSVPDPSDEEIRTALSGNLCRCTGYVQIIESVRRAAATMAAARDVDEPAARPEQEAQRV